MLTLKDFTAVRVSLAQARTVSGGATTEYVGTFRTATGTFEEYVTMNDDGTFTTDYDNVETGIQGYTNETLLELNDHQIIP